MSRVEDMVECEDFDENGVGAWSRREAARIKQIQIGKTRPEYQRYLREVPHNRRSSSQPGTPDPRARVSKRQFDRALGDWRRRLHEFDAVPRGPPRTGQSHSQAELEASWSSPAKSSWGSPEKKVGGKGGSIMSPLQDSQGSPLNDRLGARAANRRSRGGVGVAPRTERSGKFGPRKPVDPDSPIGSDPLPLSEHPVLPPPPPPPLMPQVSAPPAVRISLADQLMEMPMTAPQMMAPNPQCYWGYPGQEAWGTMETPQKAYDCQFMPMETPPDAMKMPGAGHMMQMAMYEEAAMKDYSFMVPAESDMLPHRLFDSSPEKSEQGATLENENNSDTTTLESGDGSGSSPAEKGCLAPSSPRVRPRSEDSLMPLMSPPPHFMGTPIPTTPKRLFHVPETPSPDRMHCSWMQPNAMANMPYHLPAPHGGMGGLPWTYDAHGLDQTLPEFLQMSGMMSGMPCGLPEGQTFGELQQI